MLKRFPSLPEALPVYSVAAFMGYGWNLFHFFWKVPSWLLFLTVGEVFSLLAYAMSAALVESLLIIAFALALSFLLPAKFLRDDFVVRATWLVAVCYGGMMILLALNASRGDWIGRYWILLSALVAILASLAAYASARTSWMRRAALWFSDRVIVFLFISIPASLVSLVIAIFRNLG